MGNGQDAKYGEITTEKKKLHPGEPVFLLRGQDAMAMAAILHYGVTCRIAGCAEQHMQAIEERAQAILDWQRANQALVKLPD